MRGIRNAKTNGLVHHLEKKDRLQGRMHISYHTGLMTSITRIVREEGVGKLCVFCSCSLPVSPS